MKKLFLLGIMASTFFFVKAQELYTMYETMYITPKYDKAKEFNEAFAAHNKKFHASGANAVAVQYVVNGSRAGQYVWVMGPCTFTDMDSRPSDDAHTADWNMVLPYIKEISDVEYWRLDQDLSYTPENWTLTDKIHIRSWDVKPGKEMAFREAMYKMVEVFNTKKYDNSWHVYWNTFAGDKGRDIAGVFGFDNFAFYDKDPVFIMDFEEFHGEGSWTEQMETMIGLTNMMVEEVRELVPELGGASQ